MEQTISVEISFVKKDVIRSSDTIRNEHGHLICAFDSRPRYGTPLTHGDDHLSGTKIDDLNELKKKINRKIKQWENADTISVNDLMLCFKDI